METQRTNIISNKVVLNQPIANEITAASDKTTDDYRNFLQMGRPPWLDDLLANLTSANGKKSFLVSKGNRYVNVLTENIALFYIRHEATMMMCFDKNGYYINHSLEQVQNLLSDKQFYRLNRQCLINFDAVKDVEHYLSRKLLVNAVVPTEDKLIVPKHKVSEFLHWLDNR